MYLQWLVIQSREQSHLECQLIPPLDYAFCQLDGGLANTCVYDVACIHVSCATELREASHVQRLFRMEILIQGILLELLRTFPEPHAMCLPSWTSRVSPTSSPAEGREDWFACSFCFNERVNSF